ncbi:alpha/beta fold hydrolase [Spongisporangium articulatum]|uniref:Alpha/beta fold hydrolase n=1 Tax=Spongisporangium articulatum TaxID=3362603 RepID=A0ABW8APD9_9ACTN
MVPLAGGPGLAVHYAEGPLRPFLLLHDRGQDSQTWHDVAVRLNQVGHAVAAIDLRGHGDSDLDVLTAGSSSRPVPDVDTAADDVAHLIDVLDLRGRRAPIVAGHGGGGAVALSLAARRGGVAGVACVDGGWSRPDASATDPRAWYPLIAVPTLLCAALPGDGRTEAWATQTRADIARALSRLPRATTRISWYPGAGHDIPRSSPGVLTDDLLALADRAEPGPADPHPVREVPGVPPGYLPLVVPAGGPSLGFAGTSPG